DTPPAESKGIWDILEDPGCHSGKHGLWLATNGDGLKFLDRDTKAVRTFRRDPAKADSLASNSVTSLALDRQCRLWLGTTSGVQYLEPGSTRFVAFANPPGLAKAPEVRALLVDSTQTLWVGSAKERSAWDLSAGVGADARPLFRQALADPAD